MLSFEKKVVNLFKQNRRQTGGHTYTVPSPDNYPYQWLWDSCFHAIVLSHFDLSAAKEELLALVSKQFKNGLLPHMIYWQKGQSKKFVHIDWGKKNTSSITQPPIIADSVLKVFNIDRDVSFLKVIYPYLKAFYNFLLIQRDARNHHLIGLINPDESGEDNSPRFDLPLELPAIHSPKENFKQRLALIEKNRFCNFEGIDCMKNFFWVKDLPFNCFMIKNLLSLSILAKALQKEQDSVYFKNEANLIKKGVKKYMYEDSLYWSVYQPDYSDKVTNYVKIKVKTWGLFAPLFAQLLTQQEANDLINNHLLNKDEFWLKYPVPSVAKDEPSFDPEGFWRGPTWIATNWFIFQGLLNYGFLDIAKEIYKTSKYLVDQAGFREQFNPQTGQGLGAKNFTWGTLVLDMEKSLD